MKLLYMCFRDFSCMILAEAVRAGALDEEGIKAIGGSCIESLKTSQEAGISLDVEADAFHKAIQDLERVLDAIIAKALEGPR